MASAVPADTTSTQPAPVNEPTRSSLWLRLAGLSALALLLGWGATFVLDNVQYERLAATFEARSLDVTSRRAARIKEIQVAQGSAVEPGQPLICLEDDALQIEIATRQRQIAALEAQVAAAQARVEVEIETQRRSIQQEMFDTRIKLAGFLQSRFDRELERAAWEELARAPKPLVASPVIHSNDWVAALRSEASPRDDIRRNVLLHQGMAANAQETASAQLELCEQRLAELDQLLSQLPIKLAQSQGLAAASSKLEAARADLEILQKQSDSLMLTAEQPGVVGVFRHRVGDRVLANDTLVQILDDSQRHVRLSIDSSRMNDFQPGTLVDLTFCNGWRGQGRIGELHPQADERHGESAPQLAVRIDPAGITWPKLPFGSAVEVRRRR